MSKAALKKELNTFSKDQLIEVILGAYSSSKEAKAYFEFFLNPDADALIQENIDFIFKELKRTKYGRSKGRISEIRRAVKKISDYGAADEHVGDRKSVV